MALQRRSNSVPRAAQGMSVIELVVAVALFSAFMGVFVAVTEVMGRYVDQGSGENQARSFIEDQHYVQLALDDLASRLSQPAFSREAVLEMANPPGSSGQSGNCSYDPVSTWLGGGAGLSGADPKSGQPLNSYQFCLYPTSLSEPSEDKLILNEAKPGIYVITAIPDQMSINAQPMRRIFCRPMPFCS